MNCKKGWATSQRPHEMARATVTNKCARVEKRECVDQEGCLDMEHAEVPNVSDENIAVEL